MEQELSSHGYEIDLAIDGETGLALAQGGNHDVVIVDLRVAGLSGLEAVQRIRENAATAHIPIVALTADELSAAEREHLRATLSAFAEHGDTACARLIAAIQQIMPPQPEKTVPDVTSGS